MAPPPPPAGRPRQPPALTDELVEEILLRVPPDEPACLARAALVCKGWCRLVTDPGFRCRFHQFHRTPAMLGLIICSHGHATTTMTRFFPTSSFNPSGAVCRSWSPLDARHGRILFCYDPVMSSNPERKELIVWTPATGEVRKLPRLGLPKSYCAYWNAALLCGSPGCDHMECPSGGPFTVVLVGRTMFRIFTAAYVYSSEADKWSQTASVDLPWYVEEHCTYSALVGNNALYFLLQHNKGILEYDLAKKELSSVIRLPPICDVSTTVVLMSVEDGSRLGFAIAHDDFSLRIWLMEPALTPRGGWTWTRNRVVDLKSFLPVSALSSPPCILAAADAVGVFVIRAGRDGEVFAIDLKSGRARNVPDANGLILNIIPYIGFCTPVSSIKKSLQR